MTAVASLSGHIHTFYGAIVILIHGDWNLIPSAYHKTSYNYWHDIITKLAESGDLCDNITEVDLLPPPQMKWYCYTDLQMKVILFLYPTV